MEYLFKKNIQQKIYSHIVNKKYMNCPIERDYFIVVKLISN